MIVRLAESVAETIALHSRSAYPNEGCGELVGTISDKECIVSLALTASNLSRDKNRFEIDPHSMRDAETLLRQDASRRKIIGFFHSHPDAPAIPSAADLEAATGLFQFTRAFYLYAIQQVDQNAAHELRFWRLNQSTLEFEELPWQ